MRILITILLGAFAPCVFCQEKSPYAKFGKVTVEELQKTVYALDSNADAVVLSDIGEASIQGNSKDWFSISFTRHRVVHILKKNGYHEADVAISLYSDGEAEEKLESVKAFTYNLENGKIVETKLDKSAVFKDKLDKKHVLRKFTMPNVKEGCIIEFEYKLTSDYISNLDRWDFQGESPVLWSEYTLSVPQFFTYAFLGHGYHPMYINDHKDKLSTFTVSDSRSAGATERTSFNSGVTDHRWVMKDVPELKQENFASALKNHIASIEFQLSSYNYPLTPRDFRSTWPGLTKQLLESEYFGANLNTANNWLSDDLKPVLAGAETELDKAQRIYAFVRDNFTCVDHNALFLEQN
jgi:hypothetical protein